MNKANVFLLVVVSSLLTYISTATQPAATAGVAGVAQEKWQYGFSQSVVTDDLWSFEFKTTNGYKDSWPDAQVTWTPEYNLVVPYGTNDYIRSESNKSAYPFLTGDLWNELGNNGWYPYQVIPNSVIGPTGSTTDTIYWRRRIQ